MNRDPIHESRTTWRHTHRWPLNRTQFSFSPPALDRHKIRRISLRDLFAVRKKFAMRNRQILLLRVVDHPRKRKVVLGYFLLLAIGLAGSVWDYLLRGRHFEQKCLQLQVRLVVIVELGVQWRRISFRGSDESTNGMLLIMVEWKLFVVVLGRRVA